MTSYLTTAVFAFAALLLGVSIGACVANPAMITVIADWITALAALAALLVGVATIERQRHESVQQRQMQTVQLQNGAYDDLFNDIFVLRAREAPISDDEVRSIYNRYFTAIMTGLRHYKAGLVPRSDFVEWTAILLSRFYTDKCLIDFESEAPKVGMQKRWSDFDEQTYGPKVAFRRYMTDVEAQTKAWPAGLSTEERHRACDKIAEEIVTRLDAR